MLLCYLSFANCDPFEFFHLFLSWPDLDRLRINNMVKKANIAEAGTGKFDVTSFDHVLYADHIDTTSVTTYGIFKERNFVIDHNHI